MEIDPLHHFLSEKHWEEEQIILMDITVPYNANNRIETDFTDVPLFWRKLG